MIFNENTGGEIYFRKHLLFNTFKPKLNERQMYTAVSTFYSICFKEIVYN